MDVNVDVNSLALRSTFLAANIPRMCTNEPSISR